MNGLQKMHNRSNLIDYPRRHIYFTKPESNFVMRGKNNVTLDFPLNVGYNNYYETYGNQYLSTSGKLRMALRRRQLTPLFRSHYHDLLKAICNFSYEKLELLCEDQLTQALAAKMYELKELEGYEFKTTEESKTSEDQIEIVNHMFVRNMNLARKLNPCLSLYKVVCTNSTSNEYCYMLKSDEQEV